MTTCPHCARPVPPDMAHVCTAHLTPPPEASPARESHPEIVRRARAGLAEIVRLTSGNLYDVMAANEVARKLLQELDADEQ